METRSWWRRNRNWLAVVVPVVAIAVLATAFRWFMIYQPNEWSRPTKAEGSTGTLHQEYTGQDGNRTSLDVTVTLGGVSEISEFEEAKAAPGGTMWLVELNLTADPEQDLASCMISLIDDQQVRYEASTVDLGAGNNAGKVGSTDSILWDTNRLDCVPEGFGERPATWTVQAAIVLPTGTAPTSVEIGWRKPQYLTFSIPS